MNAIKPIKHLLAGAVLAAVAAFSAHAANYNIPDSGLVEDFNWSYGIGEADDTFSITVAGPSRINVMLTDYLLGGDTFELKLDGHYVPFSTASFFDALHFQGTANNIYLSTGSHTFHIYLTALAPGYTDGSGQATFSAITAVPEPATYGMLLAGLGLLGYAARRQQA